MTELVACDSDQRRLTSLSGHVKVKVGCECMESLLMLIIHNSNMFVHTNAARVKGSTHSFHSLGELEAHNAATLQPVVASGWLLMRPY